MVTSEQVIQILFQVIDDINQLLPKTGQLEKTKETLLFGETGKLDSMGLINFIVAIEQKIEEKFNSKLSLANERTMSQNNNPFTNIGSLASHIAVLLNEKKSG